MCQVMCYEIVFAALSCTHLFEVTGANEVKNWRKTKFEYSRGENREKPKQTSGSLFEDVKKVKDVKASKLLTSETIPATHNHTNDLSLASLMVIFKEWFLR